VFSIFGPGPEHKNGQPILFSSRLFPPADYFLQPIISSSALFFPAHYFLQRIISSSALSSPADCFLQRIISSSALSSPADCFLQRIISSSALFPPAHYFLIRENGASTTLQPTNSIAQTIQALDSLEVAASTNSILRRYYLIRLVDYRNERETHYKKERPERAVRNVREGSKGYGRASSLALADLMAQAYPKLKPLPRSRGRMENEYQRRLKSLKNRISSGRNGHLIQQKFSPGILALIPTGSEYRILNSE
jgi:hemin uptake protein HemP